MQHRGFVESLDPFTNSTYDDDMAAWRSFANPSATIEDVLTEAEPNHLDNPDDPDTVEAVEQFDEIPDLELVNE